jgi:hypothetical protein
LNPNTRHKPPPAFVVELRAEPGVDAIRSLRALLKIAKRRLGLVAIDVRECALPAHQDERALAQPGSPPMSAFSERIRSQQKGSYRAGDFERDTEITLTVSRLDEAMEMFGKRVDLLNFVETGKQLQLNLTTADWLLNNLGDDPANWEGQKVVLYLAEYTYEGETKLGIRLKKPGAATTSTPTPRKTAPPPRSSAGNGNKPNLDDEIPF